MKKYILILFVGLLLASCGTKIPYTNDVRDEFGLESEALIKKVQFFTSATIILEKNKESGNKGTDDGALVSSSSKEQDRVIIPIGTKGVFEGYGPNEELIVRFEIGPGKVLRFALRPGTTSGKYYMVADWNNGRSGGSVEYGNEMYTATSSSGTAYLQVLKKNLNKTKRKDRVVKGMDVK